MTFRSILFRHADDAAPRQQSPPDCLPDLNLDQAIEAATAAKAEYDLKPFFHQPLTDAEAIGYRQAVMQDLENPAVFEAIQRFARQLRHMRKQRDQARELHYPRQKQRWFLDAAATYCSAVTNLAQDLAGADLRSQGLHGWRDYLADYVTAERFRSLSAQTNDLISRLAAVRYTVLIEDNRFSVRPYRDEPDYSAEIEATFAKFQQGAAANYARDFSDPPGMNHVEEKILEFVARLNPELFAALADYCDTHDHYVAATIRRFDREIQFYLAVLDYLAPMRRAGLSFCYPRFVAGKEVQTRDSFDIVLAAKLVGEQARVVTNDFSLTGAERILTVSGPNQGGKTTLARSFGQLHYLARLGCPVPGSEARLFLCDAVLTHFEAEENLANRRGKLEDDLIRLRRILDRATPASVVILNEIFNSTTAEDALFLSRKVLERVARLDLVCVCVTFLEEITAFDDTTVSLVGRAVPGDPGRRSYRFERRAADGLAYAVAVAEKYRLTYPQLQRRLGACKPS